MSLAALRTTMTELGFVETAADTYEAVNQGNPVRVRYVAPTWDLGLEGGHTAIKTQVETRFARPAASEFHLHERARLLLGQRLSTNDADFDQRVVIRAGAEATPVFGDEVRRAILDYTRWVPSLDLDQRRAVSLFQGHEPEIAPIRNAVFAQATLIAVMQARIDALGLA